MPLGDVPAAVLGSIGRFAFEVVFEILVKGTGYLISTRVLRVRSTDPDGILVIVLGLVFWCTLAAAIVFLLGPTHPPAAA